MSSRLGEALQQDVAARFTRAGNASDPQAITRADRERSAEVPPGSMPSIPTTMESYSPTGVQGERQNRPPTTGRTSTGYSTPCWRIDSASPASVASSKRVRG